MTFIIACVASFVLGWFARGFVAIVRDLLGKSS